jgi:hypothetical protein
MCAIIGIIRAITRYIRAAKSKYLHASSAPLSIQCYPEFTSTCGGLGQVDQHETYWIARNCVEHLHSRTCRVALVTGQLKFTGEYGYQLLISFEKKDMWPTTINIHDQAPSGCCS